MIDNSSRNNNLTLIRLVLASVVALVHLAFLTDHPILLAMTGILSSRFAVEAFFVISGYLIFASYDNAKHISTYIKNRLVRIFPAYICMILMCGFGLAFLSQFSIVEYFSLEFLEYLVFNTLMLNFMQPELPGVFVNNKVAVVNGALWTLKIEMIFYLCVPLIVFFIRRLGYFRILASLYISSELYILGVGYLLEHTNEFSSLIYQFPAQLRFFMLGSIFYYYGKQLKQFKFHIVTVGALCLGVNLFLNFDFLRPFSSGILIMALGLYYPIYSIDKFGDYSYGIYIFHYPLIQVFVYFGSFTIFGLFWGVLLWIFVLVLLAIFSWIFVEKPVLQYSKRGFFTLG